MSQEKENLSYAEKKDLILKMLYNNEGMVYPIQSFENNGWYLSKDELDRIDAEFKSARLAVSQTAATGKRLSITDEGRRFVENDSFSQSGISINQWYDQNDDSE